MDIVLVTGDRLEEAAGGIVPDQVFRPGQWPEEIWSALIDAIESLDEIIPDGLPTGFSGHISTGRLGVYDACHIMGRIDQAVCSDGCPGLIELDPDALYDVARGGIPECPECGAALIPSKWDSGPVEEAREDAREDIERLGSSDMILVLLPDENGPADEELAEWMERAGGRGVQIVGLDWCARPGVWSAVTRWETRSDPLRSLPALIRQLSDT